MILRLACHYVMLYPALSLAAYKRSTLIEIFGQSLVGQSFEILWELYWKQPNILEQMLSSLMIPIPEHEQYEQMYQNAALEEPRIRDVIDIFHVFEPSRADRLASDSMLLERLAVDMQTRSGFDTSHAARRTHGFRESYNNGARTLLAENFSQTRYCSPSWRSIGEQLHYLRKTVYVQSMTR